MAETFWLHVIGLNGDEPIDFGLDGTNKARIQFGFNILVTKYPSATFEEEIVAVLVGAGIDEGQILRSSKSQPPADDTATITILTTGGMPGFRVHNRPGSSYHRVSAQLVARAVTKQQSRALAQTALAALVEVTNTAVAV